MTFTSYSYPSPDLLIIVTIKVKIELFITTQASLGHYTWYSGFPKCTPHRKPEQKKTVPFYSLPLTRENQVKEKQREKSHCYHIF